MVQEPSNMKQPAETIRLENMAETLSKDFEKLSIEILPDLAPVSDTSASSSSASLCCIEECTNESHHVALSETSEVESIKQVDEKAWLEAEESNVSRRKVHWGDVELRYFPIVVGDHPDAQGVPVRFGSTFLNNANCCWLNSVSLYV